MNDNKPQNENDPINALIEREIEIKDLTEIEHQRIYDGLSITAQKALDAVKDFDPDNLTQEEIDFIFYGCSLEEALKIIDEKKMPRH